MHSGLSLRNMVCASCFVLSTALFDSPLNSLLFPRKTGQCVEWRGESRPMCNMHESVSFPADYRLAGALVRGLGKTTGALSTARRLARASARLIPIFSRSAGDGTSTLQPRDLYMSTTLVIRMVDSLPTQQSTYLLGTMLSSLATRVASVLHSSRTKNSVQMKASSFVFIFSETVWRLEMGSAKRSSIPFRT